VTGGGNGCGDRTTADDLANFITDIAYVVVDLGSGTGSWPPPSPVGQRHNRSIGLRPTERGASSDGELAIIWNRFRRHHFALVGSAHSCSWSGHHLRALARTHNQIDRSI
jgi:hypothetical protein